MKQLTLPILLTNILTTNNTTAYYFICISLFTL